MTHPSKRERGIALIVVLFALMLLTGIGLGLMYMTTTETEIDSNFRSEQQAYYASKAGLEEARDRLRWGSCSGGTCTGAYPSTNANYYINQLPAFSKGWWLPSTAPTANTGSVLYIVNSMGASDPVTPWSPNTTYFDDELCHENFTGLTGLSPTASTVPCAQAAPSGSSWYTSLTSTDPNTGTSSATPYKWVRITLKQDNSPPYCPDYNGSTCPNSNRPVCLTMNGVAPYSPPYYEIPLPGGFTACENDNMRSVYVLTSLATLPDGSRKMTQYEVASMVLPPMPGSITLDGSNPVTSGMNSSSMVVNGNDVHNPSSPNYNASDGCTSPYSSPAQPAIAAFDNSSVAALQSTITKPSDFQGAGGTPSVVNQSSQLGQLTTVGGLQALVANVMSTADQVYGNNPTISNLGTPTNPLVTVVNGNFSMGNAQGAGILLVTGTLYQSGNPNWDGLILVIGKGDIEKSGGGNGTVNGAILVANTCTVCAPNSPVQYLPSSGPPGTPTLNWSGGGTANINYDSCWINNLSQHSSLRVLASHEEVY